MPTSWRECFDIGSILTELFGLLSESSHRTVDQEVDGAVDGQEEVIDAAKVQST